MNGIIRKTGLVLLGTCALTGMIGCAEYYDVVDPCYPQRYMYMSRKEYKAAFAPQVFNGHVLDQTIWNRHFDTGTDRLNPAGQEHLAYIARRRPAPDCLVFLQTAQDVPLDPKYPDRTGYDPATPDKFAEIRADLDQKRIVAIQKFLTAQTTGMLSFKIEVHDPAEVGLSAIAVNASAQQMLTTRFRGGLVGGGGGAAPAGGAPAGP
jgi:hypothetical protein